MENFNFIHKVKYKEIGNFFCEEKGCPHEGICRCFEIENVEFILDNFSEIVDVLYDYLTNLDESNTNRLTSLKKVLLNYDYDTVSKYGFDRIVRKHRAFDPTNWYAEWERGFYGDEVNYISIKEHILLNIMNDFDEFENIWDLEEKMIYLLTLENGFSLKALQHKKCTILEIESKDIFFLQKQHLSKVINENNEFYYDKNYPSNLPRGICILQDGIWRVIDGYHRLSTTNKKTVKIFGFS